MRISSDLIRIVIVYAPKDREFARQLYRALTQQNLSAGLFDDTLDFEDASHLLVVCSSVATESLEIARSIRRFDAVHTRDQVIALRVGGENTELPPALVSKPGPDGFLTPVHSNTVLDIQQTTSAEAVRIAKAIHNNLFGKRILSKIGVPLRFGPHHAVAAMGLALMVSVSAFVWSIQQGSHLSAELEASEAFSSTLLDRLTAELPTNVRDDLLVSISTELLSSSASSADPRLSRADAERHIRLLHLLGEALDARSRAAEARESFRLAYQASERLSQQSPNDEGIAYLHALSAFWRANSAWRSGNISEAEPFYTEFGELIDVLSRQHPDNMLYRAELGFAAINNGLVALELGRVDQSIGMFENALERFSDGPLEAEYVSQSDVANGLAWLADARLANGEIALALDIRQREASIWAELFGERPNSTAVRIDYAHAMLKVSNLLSLLGRTDEAARSIEQALSTISGYAEADRASLRLRRLYMQLLRERSSQLIGTDRLNAAQLVLDEARRVNALWDQQGADDSRHRANAALHLLASEVAASRMAWDASYREALEALLSAQSAVEQGHVGSRSLIAEAYIARGEALLGLAEQGDALSSFRLARSILTETNRPPSPRLIDLIARIDWRLGNVERANSKLAELDELGYRPPDFVQFWRRADQQQTALRSQDNDAGRN